MNNTMNPPHAIHIARIEGLKHKHMVPDTTQVYLKHKHKVYDWTTQIADHLQNSYVLYTLK